MDRFEGGGQYAFNLRAVDEGILARAGAVGIEAVMPVGDKSESQGLPGKDRRSRVFIASTFRDMLAKRDCLKAEGRNPETTQKPFLRRRSQNPVAADVRRLRLQGNQSLLTSAATVLNEALR
ncbi:MAG: hypothetical protein HZA90_21735 [Verrucomicrobia bacterium]|nr:hypothetical protein [Verrucomicrobiota bacterium]